MLFRSEPIEATLSKRGSSKRRSTGLAPKAAIRCMGPTVKKGSGWQSRPDLNWLFRLERPTWSTITTGRLPGEMRFDLAVRAERCSRQFPSIRIVSQPGEGQTTTFLRVDCEPQGRQLVGSHHWPTSRRHSSGTQKSSHQRGDPQRGVLADPHNAL